MAGKTKRKTGDKPAKVNRLTEYVVVSVLAADRPSMTELAEKLTAEKGVPVTVGRAVGIAVREALAKRARA